MKSKGLEHYATSNHKIGPVIYTRILHYEDACQQTTSVPCFALTVFLFSLFLLGFQGSRSSEIMLRFPEKSRSIQDGQILTYSGWFKKFPNTRPPVQSIAWLPPAFHPTSIVTRNKVSAAAISRDSHHYHLWTVAGSPRAIVFARSSSLCGLRIWEALLLLLRDSFHFSVHVTMCW